MAPSKALPSQIYIPVFLRALLPRLTPSSATSPSHPHSPLTTTSPDRPKPPSNCLLSQTHVPPLNLRPLSDAPHLNLRPLSDPRPAPESTSPVRPSPRTWMRLAAPSRVRCTKGLRTGGGKKDAWRGTMRGRSPAFPTPAPGPEAATAAASAHRFMAEPGVSLE